MLSRWRWFLVGLVLAIGAVMALVVPRREPTRDDAQPSSRAGASAPPTLEAKAGEHRATTGNSIHSMDFGDSESTSPLVFGTVAPVAPVRGRVRMPDGSPAVGARVRWSNFPLGPSETAMTTDAAGAFSLERIGSASPIRATWTRDGTLSAEGDAATDGETVLTLRPGIGDEHVRVRVVGPDGSAVPTADAGLHTSHGASFERVSNGAVEFDVGDRDGREFFVLIEWPRQADGTPLPWGSARVDDVKRGGVYEARLAPERFIAGTVLGPDGRGAASVAVIAVRMDAEPARDGEFRRSAEDDTLPDGVSTDATGAFRIGRLGDGPHWVLVRPPIGILAVEPVQASAGATDIVLRLRAGVAPTILVLNPDGKPVVGASVEAQFPRDAMGRRRSVEVATGEDGSARLGHLDPGSRYSLTVTPAERDAPPTYTTVDGQLVLMSPRTEKQDLVPLVRHDWVPADTTIRLEPGLTIGGVVHDPSGGSVSGARVLCMRGDELVGSARTDEEGRFAFSGLRPGGYDVLASLLSAPTVREITGPARASVVAGTKDVVLLVSFGATLAVRVENWRERRGRHPRAILFPDDEISLRHARQSDAYTDDEGVVRFRGLDAATTYTLWIEPDADGRYVFQRGLTPGADEAKATLRAGASIAGRLKLPAGATDPRVGAYGFGVIVEGVVQRDNAYEVRGLPKGAWTVVAYATSGTTRIAGKVDVQAGATADIELTPLPPRAR